MEYHDMKLALYNEYFIIIVDADGLVLYHWGISSISSEYAAMRFQLFRG